MIGRSIDKRWQTQEQQVSHDQFWKRIKNYFAAHIINGTGVLLFLLLAIFVIWPIISVLIKSIYDSTGLTLKYYKEFITYYYYYRSFFNTLILGILTTCVCLTVGFCIAYMTTRGPERLRKPIKLIALIPLIAPSYIFALSLLTLLGNRGIITKALGLQWDIYGFPGVVLAQTLGFLPLSYIMIENTLSSLNPNLEDSAANLGASEVKILRSITLPLLIPSFLKTALIVFVMAVAEFGNVALLCGRTPFLAPDTYLMITGEANFNMGSVLSAFLILPCAIIFIIQNYLIKGNEYTTIVGKPVAAEPRHITPVILIPFLTVALVTCGLILVTFGVVGAGAFTKILGVDNTLTLSHMFDKGSAKALYNSLTIASLSGLFGAILGVFLAYVIARGKFRGRAILEGISIAGFTLPGTVMGIGYLLAFNKPPLWLTGTTIILIINCIFRHLAVGVEAGITKLQQLSIEVEEASLNLGASAATTFIRIVLPIIFPAFLYGFMYVFMTTMVSISSLIFLVSPGFSLASIYIFDAASWGHIGMASAVTLKLIAVVAVCLGIIQYLSKWTGMNALRRKD
jgi:iron(III) transport system permease protein